MPFKVLIIGSNHFQFPLVTLFLITHLEVFLPSWNPIINHGPRSLLCPCTVAVCVQILPSRVDSVLRQLSCLISLGVSEFQA
jgi:hypothetical protein